MTVNSSGFLRRLYGDSGATTFVEYLSYPGWLDAAEKTLTQKGYSGFSYLGNGHEAFVIAAHHAHGTHHAIKLRVMEVGYGGLPGIVLRPLESFKIERSGFFAEIHEMADRTRAAHDLVAVLLALAAEGSHLWEDIDEKQIGRVAGKPRILDPGYFVRRAGSMALDYHRHIEQRLPSGFVQALYREGMAIGDLFAAVDTGNPRREELSRLAGQNGLFCLALPPGIEGPAFLADPALNRTGQEIARELELEKFIQPSRPSASTGQVLPRPHVA